MAEDCKINISRISFAVGEIFYSKEKVFKNILGVDWFVSAQPGKKIELKKSRSIRNISFLSNLIKVTVRCKGLPRRVLAEIKIIKCPLQYPNMKDMIFNHVCEKGNNSICSEVKLDSAEGYSWMALNGEFSLYVSPENFFYFKFSNDNSLQAGVSESSQNILSELTDDLSELYKRQDFSDVDIKCGEEVFKAHKVILSSRSPVFAAMFQHKMRESEENVIDIKDMDPNVLSILLEFIYCGKIDNLSSTLTAGDLLSAAEQYQLTGLKKACLSFLQCAMSDDNVLSVLALADLHDSTLKKISVDFVCKEFDHLKNTEEWKRFQKEKPGLANEVLLNIIGFVSEHGHKLC